MKQLAIGTTNEYDIYTPGLPGVLIALNGVTLNYTDPGVAHYITLLLHIGDSTGYLAGSGTITVTQQIGTAAGAARTVINAVETGAVDATESMWVTKPVALSALEDTIRVYVHSDNASDTAVTIVAEVFELESTDVNGRVDVGSWLGTAAATPETAGVPSVDVYSTGGATPISLADILGKVYEGLSSVVTAVVTSDTTTSFTLTAGANIASAYVGQLIAIEDAGDNNIEVREIVIYTSGRIVTVNRAFSFTPAVDDAVWILNMVGSAHQLNTAIPGSPTVNSINQRIAAMDY